jgi:hypothetical protein
VPGYCNQVYVSSAASIACLNIFSGLISRYVDEQWKSIENPKGFRFHKIAISSTNEAVALETLPVEGGNYYKGSVSSDNGWIGWQEIPGL